MKRVSLEWFSLNADRDFKLLVVREEEVLFSLCCGECQGEGLGVCASGKVHREHSTEGAEETRKKTV